MDTRSADPGSYSPPGFERYGLTSGGPRSTTPTELNAVSSPAAGAAATAKPWSPSNPLFWFGVVATFALGLAAVSTSVRVGPVKAGVSLGK